MSRHEELLAEDERGRRAAQTEFERPLLLEAGAGTGKTTTLIHRILAWSLGAGWLAVQREGDGEDEAESPDRIAARVLEGIVAVTFTEAAAAEMAARVAEALARVAGGGIEELEGFLAGALPADAEPGVARRAAALLGAIDHLTVSTIHAWCRGLLANHAVDAGLHPDFGVDPRGERIEAVAREVTEEAIRAAYGGGDRSQPLVRLAAAGIGPRRVVAALTDMARRALPASALAADPFAGPVVDGLVAELKRALAALLEAAAPLEHQRGARLLGPQVYAAATTTFAGLGQLPPEPLPRTTLLAALLAELWPDNLRGRLKDWRKGRLKSGESDLVGAGAAALADAAGRLEALIDPLRQLDPRLLDAARRALEPLLAETGRRLRAQGIASFDSLLLDARALLGEHPEVRRQLRAGLRQLLVDEFQDTDRVQCDLVRLLALRGAGRRPGLFVVGDPKQSIYGWRNADLGAYDAFAAELETAGGERYSLCRNFRSAPAILAEVERAVAPVMLAEEGLQPPFEPLLPSEKTRGRSGFCAGGSAPVELWVAALGSGRSAEAQLSDEEAAELEAAAVAADIRRLHDEHGVPWREFGILMRSGSRVEIFESALRAAAVPFTVSRDRQYYRRREVIDVAALVRTIVDPADHVALLTYLRSPAAGLPDAALLPLWSRGFPKLVTELQRPAASRLRPLRELLAEVAELLPADLPGLERVAGWELAVAAAVEHLAELRRDFLRLPADRFVERLRTLTMTEVGEAARYLGQFRAANLDRFFRELEEALAERGGDVQAVLRALRRSLAEAVEPDEQRPRDPTENAAQVITVHSAKGLEFGHVYLVEIQARTGGADPLNLDLDERWPSRERLEYTLFTSPTPGFHAVRRERQRVEAAERVRTLYVAMTRARERLVLVGRWPARPVAVAVEAARSHADLLCCRAEPAGDLEELGRRAEGGRIDHAGARWVFLTPAASPPAAPAAESAPPPLSAERAAREEKTLAACRRAAAERMELPLGRPASQEAAARLEALRGGADGPGDDAGPSAGRDVAMQVGVAVHRLFEEWRFEEDPAAELARGRARAHQELAAVLPAQLLGQAVTRADELLERIARGELLARFLELGPAVRGREVPVLLPPDAAAAGFISGALDLLYADPESGELVIVDFKTDRVEGETAIAQRAAAYAPQETLYARAVAGALGLASAPRTELWFLWPDRLWTGA